MTQIIGDAKHLKGKPLSGAIASGQVWEFNGSAFVPVTGPTSVGAVAAGASGVAAAVSGAFSGFYHEEYPSFLDDEFYPLSGHVDATSGVASYASGVVDDVSGQSGLVLASGAGLVVFQGTPASGKVPKLSGTNVLTDLYWANDETAAVSGVLVDVVAGRIEFVSATQIKWRFYSSSQIRLWNPTLGQWEMVSCASEHTFPSSGADLNGSGLVAASNYDVYAQYSSQSGFDLVLNKWTTDTARSVTPAQWQGVLCYDNTSDDGKKRRFLGTVRLVNNSGVPNFAWSSRQRFIANYMNRLPTAVYVSESTSHDYDSGVYRPWNNDSGLTAIEWLSLEPTPRSIECRFYYDPAAAGDRAAIRAIVNGGTPAPVFVQAAGSYGETECAFLWAAEDRLGYNYAYAEEYGYVDDLIYSSITLNLQIQQ